jgi:hypothetical protein
MSTPKPSPSPTPQTTELSEAFAETETETETDTQEVSEKIVDQEIESTESPKLQEQTPATPVESPKVTAGK